MGLSYPIIRSKKINLTAMTNYQHKEFDDTYVKDIQPSIPKSSDNLPMSLNFDVRDELGGGAITYGAVTYTHGRLKLTDNDPTKAANTRGSFNKLNLDIARLQALPDNFTMYGRISSQFAGNNLDSSEKFGLGGVNGVRAFPSGEGFGDSGMLAQIELRYNINSFAPYAFYDAGTTKINHNTFSAGSNHRSVAGGGLGLRYEANHWSADTSVAWRTAGGLPKSDTKVDTPTLWIAAKYKF